MRPVFKSIDSWVWGLTRSGSESDPRGTRVYRSLASTSRALFASAIRNARRCQAGQSNATEEPAHKQDRFFLRGRSKAADSPDVAQWGNQGQQGEA